MRTLSKREFLTGFSAALLSPAFSGGAALAGPQTRTIKYYGNQQVTVPAHVTKVATSWEAMNSILTMLGYGEKIVATTRYAKSIPLFRKYVPAITHAALTTMGGPSGLNVETLIRLHPDILFTAGPLPPAQAAALKSSGIAVASFHANSMDEIVKRTLITGQILGPGAYKKAEVYRAYFEHNKKRVAERLKTVPKDKRLKVYLASGTPRTTSGRPSLDQDWMDLGGAINVAEKWQLTAMRGNPHTAPNTSMEAIVAANPDVIIVMRPQNRDVILHDPRWQNIKAVKTGRVYANPSGIFWWCRETTEEALQFLWLAHTLYPQAFRDIDMKREVGDFYAKFYGMHFTDAEIEQTLWPAGKS